MSSYSYGFHLHRNAQNPPNRFKEIKTSLTPHRILWRLAFAIMVCLWKSFAVGGFFSSHSQFNLKCTAVACAVLRRLCFVVDINKQKQKTQSHPNNQQQQQQKKKGKHGKSACMRANGVHMR